MCGICGIVMRDSEQPVEHGLIERMTDSLVHRGPDAGDVHVDGQVALGHRRLRIIDLSERGAQPMTNEDGSVYITYNGEVYNFAELRHDLERRGHQFRSRTDTEVIVHLYEDHGPDCVAMLRGMFAFAIWNSRRRTLLLARDRIGIKPLYYHLNEGRIAFASEMRALLALPDVERQIDADAVDAYLTTLFVPGSRSVFTGVEKLPPGSYGVWQDGRFSVSRYWQPDDSPDRRRDEADLDHLQALLEDAVRARLVSDVPLGIFLSGGIDSGLVTALASRVSPDPVKTFTISFEGHELDEAPYARMVSERYGTEHTETTLSAGALSPELVVKLADHLDEPFADASTIPTFLLCEATRQQVTVALAGDGGDELFAGYQHHDSFARVADMQRRFPRAIRRVIGAIGRHVVRPGAARIGSSHMRRAAKSAEWLGLSAGELVVASTAYALGDEKRSLYGPRMADVTPDSSTLDWIESSIEGHAAEPRLATCLAASLRTALVDDMLVKVDRMSMYHALEVRVPVLDTSVVDYASTIREGALLRGGVGKRPLRRLAERLLPAELVSRPKQGFHAPLDALGSPGFSELLHDTLSESRIRDQGYFDPRAVSDLVTHFEDKRDRFRGRMSRYQVNHRLWSLFMFTLWHDRYAARPTTGVSR